MLLRPTASVAVLLLSLALLAGCGGDDGGADSTAVEASTTSNKTWNGSKQAFIKKADAICRQGGERIYRGIVKSLSPAGVDGSNAPGMKRAVETALVPGFEAEIREIRALGFPAGEDAEVEAVLGALVEQIERAKAEPAVFLKEGNPLAEPEELGGEYGFAVCGNIS